MDRRYKAFTLIELLIVVAIIGILAAIAIPNFQNARIRSKVSAVKADLSALRTALEIYRLDAGSYPPDSPRSNNAAFPLYVLTTPMPYIDRLPADLFCSMFLREMAEINAINSYFYTGKGTIEFISQGYSELEMEDFRGIWSMYSCGPDGEYDSGNMVMVKASKNGGDRWQYDMSNGLGSDGDIAIWGP